MNELGVACRYQTGDAIYQVGDSLESPGVFLITSGTVELLWKQSDGMEKVVSFGEGELFGILEIYIAQKRLLGARARENVELRGFSRIEFERMMVYDSEFAFAAFAMYTRILRVIG